VRAQSAKRASGPSVQRISRKVVDDSSSNNGSAKTSSSNVISRIRNGVLSISHDTSPFFYSGGGRSITGTTLVVATADGECLRVHINSPVEREPTNVLIQYALLYSAIYF
jgi:hypothetical protein